MSDDYDSRAAVDQSVELTPVAELPRLSIVHLLAWMAATAIAFTPYQIQLQSAQANANVNQYWQSLVATMMYVVYGVMSGTCLFVAAARVYWRWRGVRTRFEPGHWLAIESVGGWLVTMLLWIALAQGVPAGAASFVWIALPRFVFGLAVLVGFLWLAVRSGETAAWRLTYLAIAFIPLLSVVTPMITAYFASISPVVYQTAILITYCAVTGVQLLMLSIAAMSDASQNLPRHWSHWAAIAAKITSCLMGMAYYAWISIYPSR